MLLLIFESGQPWLADWTSGSVWELPAALLAAPESGIHSTGEQGATQVLFTNVESMPASSGTSAVLLDGLAGHDRLREEPSTAHEGNGAVALEVAPAARRVDACFHPQRCSELFVLSRGRIFRLSCSLLNSDAPSGVERGAVGRILVLRCSDVAGPSYRHLTNGCPEILHSRHNGFLLATGTGRAGVVVLDSDSLQELPNPAAWPEGDVTLLSARLVRRDTLIFAVPSGGSQAISGAVAFLRGVPTDAKVVPGPAACGSLAAIESHPWLGVVMALTKAGDVFVLQQGMPSTPWVFPGPMYPPGFKLQVQCDHCDGTVGKRNTIMRLCLLRECSLYAASQHGVSRRRG
jgi:hypothetical protein